MRVMKKSKAKKGTMKRILSYIKPYKKQIIGAMLTAILYVVLNLTTPVLIGQAIDKAIGKGNVDFQAMLNYRFDNAYSYWFSIFPMAYVTFHKHSKLYDCKRYEA